MTDPGPRIWAVTPVFGVPDVDATVAWSEEAFGCRAHPFPETPPYSFAILERDRVQLFLRRTADRRAADESGERGSGGWDVQVFGERASELE
ncbi:MAG: hypothetical protein ACE5HP_06035 [Gemmatimonadota bacterium]